VISGVSLGHLRSLLLTIPAALAVTGLMITFAIVTSPIAPAGRWQWFLARAWGAMVLAICRTRVRLRGAARLDAGAHYVVVANHASLLDIPILMRWMPLPIRFLAKQELLKVPFIGWYLRRAGHLTVSRGSVRSSLASMNEAARMIGERRLSVLLFPEGTRSDSGEMQPFKDGAAYLALRAGVPVAPVAIAGSHKLLPARSSHFRGGEVEVRIGEPVSTAGYTLKDRERFTALLEERVRALLASPREAT
jgi:1-acyl-sn-glycerol-3-phosphate acyltransferase